MAALSNQLVLQPTRQRNILDIQLASPKFISCMICISGVNVVPALGCRLIMRWLSLISIYNQVHILPQQKAHSVYLHHKGDLDSVKQKISNFRNLFLSTNPQLKSHSSGIFKQCCKQCCKTSLRRRLSFVNIYHDQIMTLNMPCATKGNCMTELLLNSEESCNICCRAHNKVSKMLKIAHVNYHSQILDTAFSGQQC